MNSFKLGQEVIIVLTFNQEKEGGLVRRKFLFGDEEISVVLDGQRGTVSTQPTSRLCATKGQASDLLAKLIARSNEENK